MTSTTASLGSAGGLPAGAERVDGRFELVALVKRGNGIDTYSGIDHLHDTDVVIKTVETAAIPTAALRAHAGHVLQEVGRRIDPSSGEEISMSSILGRARDIVQRGATGTEF